MKRTAETLQYLSVLRLGEIEKGILLLDEGKRRRERLFYGPATAD
jgi:hypothetical protein